MFLCKWYLIHDVSSTLEICEKKLLFSVALSMVTMKEIDMV